MILNTPKKGEKKKKTYGIQPLFRNYDENNQPANQGWRGKNEDEEEQKINWIIKQS